MFEKIKRLKNIGLTKNSKKYTITHNGNLDSFDRLSYGASRVIYLLKPVTVIEETPHSAGPSDKKEIIFERGHAAKIISNTWNKAYIEIKFKENLTTFQPIYETSSFMYHPEIKDQYKYYHANKDYLCKYAIACTNFLSITITSLTESITLDYETLSEKIYDNDFEIFKLMCRLIDIFENFEPIIVNQFAPGIIDTIKTFLSLLDSDTNYSNKREMIMEVQLYIKDVYETILSFGENIETFLTPFELIEQYRIKKEQEKKDEEERRAMEKRISQKRHDDFLTKVRARRELLQSFNEPLENIPLKLAEKNKELLNDFMKNHV